MSLVPSTTSRVPEHTAVHINRRIEQEIEASVAISPSTRTRSTAGSRSLDREWDIERTLEANAASFSLLGLTLGLTLDRRWLAVAVGVAAFLLQHAVQGWCPPVTFFRRRGARTAREIEDERIALKALRGDFDHLPRGPENVDAVIAAARR